MFVCVHARAVWAACLGQQQQQRATPDDIGLIIITLLRGQLCNHPVSGFGMTMICSTPCLSLFVSFRLASPVTVRPALEKPETAAGRGVLPALGVGSKDFSFSGVSIARSRQVKRRA